MTPALPHSWVRRGVGTVLGDFYAFDPATLRWAAVCGAGEPPAPRYGLGMAALGSDIYVCGGGGASGAQRGCPSNVPDSTMALQNLQTREYCHG